MPDLIIGQEVVLTEFAPDHYKPHHLMTVDSEPCRGSATRTLGYWVIDSGGFRTWYPVRRLFAV